MNKVNAPFKEGAKADDSLPRYIYLRSSVGSGTHIFITTTTCTLAHTRMHVHTPLFSTPLGIMTSAYFFVCSQQRRTTYVRPLQKCTSIFRPFQEQALSQLPLQGAHECCAATSGAHWQSELLKSRLDALSVLQQNEVQVTTPLLGVALHCSNRVTHS